MEYPPGQLVFPRPDLHEDVGSHSKLNDRLTAASTTDQERLWQELARFYTENEQTIDKATKTDVATEASGIDPSDLSIAIDTCTETTKVILDGLVMLGNVHPILGVAIFAFHSVISLDLSRRDNNKKVMAVKLQMQNMMCTMFQFRKLKHIHIQEQEKAHQTVLLQRLVTVIADDIKACGSDLNYYMDRRFIAKLVNAKIYEHRFANYIETFALRRSELQGLLTAYTASGVDFANTTLIAVGSKLDSMDDKLSRILRALDSPSEKEASKFIEENGGAENCIIKEELFQRLLSKAGQASGAPKSTDFQREELSELRRTLLLELGSNLEEALAKNHARFEKLLAVQSNNLERLSDRMAEQGLILQRHDMRLDKLVTTSLLILEEGRLVKKAVVPSLNIKMKDEELQRIWDRMGLKRSVKATTFILTFRDHFLSDHSAINTPFAAPLSPLRPGTSPLLLSTEDTVGENAPSDVAAGLDPDIWLLKYIDVTHVRPIVEAIDEDGSGFISIKEANKFALSKPKGWNLLRWMAYWAAGWHISITNYRSKLYSIIRQMHNVLDSVLLVNRYYINRYFDHYNILHYVEGLLRSTNPLPSNTPRDSRLVELVKEMSDLTEQRVLANLKGVSFAIKSTSDVMLIVGSGRVETWIYPLLYLLLRRHLEIIELGKKVVLSPNEMEIHTSSLSAVFAVFSERKQRLEAIFRQMYRDVDAQFKNYAYGMFFASFKELESKLSENTLLTYGGADEDNHADPLSPSQDSKLSILTEGIGPLVDFEKIRIATLPHCDDHHIQHAIEGAWTGICIGRKESELTYAICLELVLGPIMDRKLSGPGQSLFSSVEIDGHVELPEQEGGSVSAPIPVFIKMMRKETDYNEIFCNGIYDEETIRGSWLYHDTSEGLSFPFVDAETKARFEEFVDDEKLGYFYLTKGSGDILRFRCLLDDPNCNPSWTPARKRWAYSTRVTLFQIQRQKGSRAFWRARVGECRRLIELLIRTWLEAPGPRGYITTAEVQERLRLMSSLHPSVSIVIGEIASYYFERCTFAISTAVCDVCSQLIIFTRFVCITCQEETFNDEVDMCAECIDSTEFTNLNKFVHHPSHSLVRFTRRLFYCQRTVVIPQARLLAAKIQASFKASGVTGVNVARHSSDIGIATKSDADNIIMSRPALTELTCSCCGKDLKLPCWACVTCEPDTLLCLECECENTPVQQWKTPSKHLERHPLLRISHIEEVKTNDLKTNKLERNLESTMDTVAGLEHKVNSQFQEVKTLLDEVARKLEQSPDGARSPILQAGLTASPQGFESSDSMALGNAGQDRGVGSALELRDDRFQVIESRLDRLEKKVDSQFGALTSLIQELISSTRSHNVAND